MSDHTITLTSDQETALAVLAKQAGKEVEEFLYLRLEPLISSMSVAAFDARIAAVTEAVKADTAKLDAVEQAAGVKKDDLGDVMPAVEEKA